MIRLSPESSNSPIQESSKVHPNPQGQRTFPTWRITGTPEMMFGLSQTNQLRIRTSATCWVQIPVQIHVGLDNQPVSIGRISKLQFCCPVDPRLKPRVIL